jgi:hypothetical protein
VRSQRLIDSGDVEPIALLERIDEARNPGCENALAARLADDQVLRAPFGDDSIDLLPRQLSADAYRR